MVIQSVNTLNKYRFVKWNLIYFCVLNVTRISFSKSNFGLTNIINTFIYFMRILVNISNTHILLKFLNLSITLFQLIFMLLNTSQSLLLYPILYQILKLFSEWFIWLHKCLINTEFCEHLLACLIGRHNISRI